MSVQQHVIQYVLLIFVGPKMYKIYDLSADKNECHKCSVSATFQGDGNLEWRRLSVWVLF